VSRLTVGAGQIRQAEFTALAPWASPKWKEAATDGAGSGISPVPYSQVRGLQ